MLSFIGRIAIIIVVASGLGILNAVALRHQPLIPDLGEMAKHEAWKTSVAISLDELVKASGNAIVIDARPKEEFAKSRLKTLQLLNIDAHDVESDPEIADRLYGTGLPVYLYCSSEICDLAEELYKALMSLNPSLELRIFHGGWEEIEKHPELISTGKPPATNWFDVSPAGGGESARDEANTPGVDEMPASDSTSPSATPGEEESENSNGEETP